MMAEKNYNRRSVLKGIASGSGVAALSTTAAAQGPLDLALPLDPVEDPVQVSRYQDRTNPEVVTEPSNSQTVSNVSSVNGGVLEYNWDHRVFSNSVIGGTEIESAVSWVDFEVSDVSDPSKQVDFGVELDFDVEGKLETSTSTIFSVGDYGDSPGAESDTLNALDSNDSGLETSSTRAPDIPEIPGPVGYLDVATFLSASKGQASYTIGGKVVKLNDIGEGEYELNRTGVKNENAYEEGVNGFFAGEKSIDRDDIGMEFNPSGYSDQIIRVIVGIRVETDTASAGISTADFKGSGKGFKVDQMKLWVDDVS